MSAMSRSQRAGEPLSAGQAEMEGESIVADCDATNCLYNQAQLCTAGAINVSFVNGMANCATFTPRADQRTFVRQPDEEEYD